MCITVTVILILISVSAFVFASDEPRMPDVEYTPMTLTVYFHIDGAGGEKISVDGAEFGICKVADLTVSGGSADYSTAEPFASVSVYGEDGRDATFSGVGNDGSLKLAKELSVIAWEKDLLIKKNAVKGECTFTVDEPGIYLVVETSKSGDADKYETADPFLVTVPSPHKGDAGYEWSYSVKAEPKTTLERIPEPETDSDTEPVEPPSPVTGNDINVAAWLSLAVSVLCIILIALISAREEKQSE